MQCAQFITLVPMNVIYLYLQNLVSNQLSCSLSNHLSKAPYMRQW